MKTLKIHFEYKHDVFKHDKFTVYVIEWLVCAHGNIYTSVIFPHISQNERI